MDEQANRTGEQPHGLTKASQPGSSVASAARQQAEPAFATELLNTVPAVILLLNPDGTIQYVNPYFERLCGYRLDEIRGKDWFDTCLPEAIRQSIRAQFRAALQGKPTRGSISPIVTRGGEQREIEWNDQLLRDGEGRTTALLANGVDVTERIRYTENTRLNAARLNDAQRIAKVGSWELDLQTGALYWTDEIFNLFELDSARFGATYEAFLNAIHPEDRDKVNRAYTESVAKRTPYEMVHRLRMADGRIKWVEERGATDFNADGTPLISRGTVQDITERYLLEEKLRTLNEELERRVAERTASLGKSERRLREAQTLARIGNWEADLVTGELAWSDEIYRIFGHQPGAIAPSVQAFLAAVHPADLEKVRDSERRAATTGKHDVVHRILRPDGTVRHVHELAKGQTDAAGRLVRLAGTVQDVTERVEAEQALIATRDEAERANRAKTEFLSRMSHELRTPLNAVLGFAQLLDADSLTAAQRGHVREILQGGGHLLQMINEVLDLARIEAGKLSMEIEAVACQPIVEACVATIRPLADRRRLTLSVSFSGACALLADPLRLRQVLLNLLSNAVKYNREAGNVQVHCQADGKRVRISVQDSGIGIAETAMARLFQPFERLESAYSGIEGAGIGLALSKRLVEAMGGAIGAESEAGRGSTFWFEFPRAPDVADRASDDSTAAPEPVSGRRPQRTVLCVEDNPANLRLMQRILDRRDDLCLIDAHSGELGMEVARARRPDLILLDIGLPGINGFELLRRLRADQDTRDIPVVAVSANAMPHDIARGLGEGFADYITKPIDVRRFLDMIDRQLPGSDPGAPVPPGSARAQ